MSAESLGRRSRRPPRADCSGATLYGRGATALIVEVEAYGGPPTVRGPTPPRIRSAVPAPQHRDVRPRRAAVHLSQPRHPRLRQRGLRPRRNRRSGPAAGRCVVDGDSTSARVAPRCGRCDRGVGARSREPVLGAGNHHGGQRNRPLRRPAARFGSSWAERDGRERPARRRQQGRRPAVAVLAGRTCPRCRRIGAVRGRRRPATATGIREDRTSWARRSSTSWTGAD